MSGDKSAPPLGLTRLPLRFALQSHDKLCHVSMRLEWSDGQGEQHTWSSWGDSLCGYYAAVKFLPADSTDICVSFHCHPAGRRLHKVNRHRGCAWVQGDELIRLRNGGLFDPPGLDARFVVRGPLLHCYVWRAWNARNSGVPAEWEAWASCPPTSIPLPRTLLAADSASWPGIQSRMVPAEPGGEGDTTEQIASAMERFRAAADAMLEVRQETLAVLNELKLQLKQQWYGVNSTNTLAAGLAVASFATLFTLPPVGMALGVGSAAAGIGATTGDAVADGIRGNRFVRAIQADNYEQLGFEAVEGELRVMLQSAACVGNPYINSRRSQALTLGTQSATLAVVRAGRVVAATRAGHGLSIAGKVLGGVGAGLAIGVALHGWSTLKPTQKMVKEKLAEVDGSIEYLTQLSQQVARVLHCPQCHMPLDFGNCARPIWRCRRFHCFHVQCVGAQGAGVCPLCPPAAEQGLVALGGPAEHLRALLWRAGIRGVAGIETLAPQALFRGWGLVEGLSLRAQELQRRQGQPRQALHELLPRAPAGTSPLASQLPEDADTHEAWQDAVGRAGSPAAVPQPMLDSLLAAGQGMPLKHRHTCWPQWLRVHERQAAGLRAGRSFGALCQSALPESVQAEVEADIPRTPPSLVPPAQHGALRRVLVAVAAAQPAVGYAQGMNQVAAVFLKLGFEEETAFWMLEAVFEDLVPACHAPDLHGLFRDTAAADVLVQTFLPEHASAMASSGFEMLWITVDYFMTLGSKDAPLAFVVRLWDLCFLHGPRALFSGLLALVELFFQVSCGASTDAEEVLGDFRRAYQVGDPEVLASQLLRFLHEPPRCISAELVAGLRSSMGQQRITVQSLPPDVLCQASDLVSGLWASAERLAGRGSPSPGAEEQRLAEVIGSPLPRAPAELRLPLLEEDAATHEAWQDAVAKAGSLAKLDRPTLDALLTRRGGAPLKYRLACWPQWLRASEQKAAASAEASSFAQLAAMALQDDWQERRGGADAALRCIPPDFLSPAQGVALQQILRALSVHSPGISCMHHIAQVGAVFIKLGFEEEVSFWMLTQALGNLVPACHDASFHGLLRDVAVADILLQAFLPACASTLSSTVTWPLSLAAKHFLTLGMGSAALPLVLRLWDLYFLHGPSAMFSAFLVSVEVFVGTTPELDRTKADELAASYCASIQNGDPEAFSTRILHFLHKRQGGISEALVSELRSTLGVEGPGEGTPSLADASCLTWEAPNVCQASEMSAPGTDP